MTNLEPGFIEGVLTALIISIFAGFFVTWVTSRFRAAPKLTWELVSVFEIKEKLPIFLRFEEDGKLPSNDASEYGRRLRELSSCSYFSVVRILNRGTKPASSIKIILKEKPYYVDTFEKSGVKLTEFGDGIFEIELRSLSQDSCATIGFFSGYRASRDIKVEHSGVSVVRERTISEDRDVRRGQIRNALALFSVILIFLSLLILALDEIGVWPLSSAEPPEAATQPD